MRVKSRGAILILVLAVLVLLSLLATVSASLQALARLESIRYMEVLELADSAQLAARQPLSFFFRYRAACSARGFIWMKIKKKI